MGEFPLQHMSTVLDSIGTEVTSVAAIWIMYRPAVEPAVPAIRECNGSWQFFLK